MGQWARRLAGATLIAGAGAAVAWTVKGVRTEFGGQRTATSGERVRRSPQFRDGVFHNRTRRPAPSSGPASRWGCCARRSSASSGAGRPRPVPLVTPSVGAAPSDAARGSPGTATPRALVEIDGAPGAARPGVERALLAVASWSGRAACTRCRCRCRTCRRLDAVLISHDHYDHLDMATVRELVPHPGAPFLVPLGVGAHLDAWGVPADADRRAGLGRGPRSAGLRLTATAAQHFSGRGLHPQQHAVGVLGGRRARPARCSSPATPATSTATPGIGAEHGPFDAP